MTAKLCALMLLGLAGWNVFAAARGRGPDVLDAEFVIVRLLLAGVLLGGAVHLGLGR